MARNPLIAKIRAEHDRLGIEPTVAGVSHLHDENGIPKAPPRPKSPQPPPPPFSNEPEHIRASVPQQPPPLPPAQARGPNLGQMPAHVGVHEETMWFDDKVVGSGQRPPPQVIDNNKDVDTDALQGYNPLNPSESTRWHEQNMPQDWHDQNVPQESMPQQVDPESLEAAVAIIPPGGYLLLVEGEPVVVRTDKRELRSIVADVLLKHNVDIDRVQVLKSVPIDFGVLMED